MLLELHNTIQRLLYERGQISPREVGITFEAPTRERIEKLTRPTISVFLFDLQENTDLRQSDFERTRNNGRGERRSAPRRFDLRYMVSALTTETEDEHELLWRVLLTLIRHQQFPQELLPEELSVLEPSLITRICQGDEDQHLSALWTALGAQPHPALYYVVTVPVDMNMVIEAPLVLTRIARYTRTHIQEIAPEIGIQIGGVVRNKDGEPLSHIKVALAGRSAIGSETNEEGRFVLTSVPSGTVKLLITQPDGAHKIVTVEVPEPRSRVSSHNEQPYDIVMEAATT